MNTGVGTACVTAGEGHPAPPEAGRSEDGPSSRARGAGLALRHLDFTLRPPEPRENTLVLLSPTSGSFFVSSGSLLNP